ncbi:restriction endonuclease subunit S [Ichthyobacterium seriolicida]|uniref:Type I restriction-modification system, specificity subunit S n=1 Tax=Ichthyobacterium seriolicida TaxID=242600 RepID=A0A1J1E5N5_9FLAO|nr:restriction endonuclease subunit S [Ichthyobacterium seriolicida]BAV95364.1 type I restriction-modification system, specificity subunit S [Ichthyobacterium seriolicida]
MKRYDSYKDSGVEWLGEIPEHWEIKKLNNQFEVNTGFTPSTNNSDYYENGTHDWLTITDLDSKYVSTSKTKLTDLAVEGRNKVPKGSLLYSFKLSVGKMAFVEKDVYTNEAIFAIYPDVNINLNYYYYLFGVILAHNSNKNIYGANILNQELIKASKLVVPESEEQTQIANFLDLKTAQIDDLISKKEKLIELLKEERTANINQAVTKGLDPNVPMKDSGIEWLGDIPEHWESWKISHAFEKIGSGTTPKSGNTKYHEEGTINWLNTGDLNNGVLYNCQKKITSAALEDYSSLKLYPKGSLVIAMYGATIGKTSLLEFETTTNQACCVFSESEKIDLRFLQHWFNGNKEHIINLAVGGGQPNISQDILKGIRIFCPSKIEQTQITNYLDCKTAQIDDLVSKKEKEIVLLNEYKTALISEVVTGKVDVRDEDVDIFKEASVSSYQADKKQTPEHHEE